MSYREPMVINEPNLRWPIYFVAAITTGLLVTLATCVTHFSATRPHKKIDEVQRVENAIRHGVPEFERLREQIILENFLAEQTVQPFDDLTIDMTAIIRNSTGRTISGLEMRGAVLDAEKQPLRERTVVVIPLWQTALEPNEVISVRIMLPGVRREKERSEVMMELAAVRFN